MNKNLLTAISSNADLYRQENLVGYDPSELATDWWQALDFFLSRACFQGRRDDVSQRVYENASRILSPLFSGTHQDESYESQPQDWNAIRAKLSEVIGKGKVGKARDVEMVISSLRFIGDLPSKNIIAYSVAKIKEGKLREHYDELQAAKKNNGIIQVGPKIAALYLRDIVSVFTLTDLVGEAAFCLQAVDTWVRQLAEKLDIVNKKQPNRLFKRRS